MLPVSPDMLRFAAENLAVNTITALGGRGYNGVVNVTAATYTLTQAQSGALVLFNKADGATVTLPAAPTVGTFYDFVVGTTITGSNAVIVTGASCFIAGALSAGIDATTPGTNPGPKYWVMNGSSHTTITMNGTTTGGYIGTHLRYVAVSPTVWAVTGNLFSSGTIATPVS